MELVVFHTTKTDPWLVSVKKSGFCCQHAQTSNESPIIHVTNTQTWIMAALNHKLICCSHAILLMAQLSTVLMGATCLTRLHTNQTCNQTSYDSHRLLSVFSLAFFFFFNTSIWSPNETTTTKNVKLKGKLRTNNKLVAQRGSGNPTSSLATKIWATGFFEARCETEHAEWCLVQLKAVQLKTDVFCVTCQLPQ